VIIGADSVRNVVGNDVDDIDVLGQPEQSRDSLAYRVNLRGIVVTNLRNR
jgi:hypothetical protein